MHDELNNTHNLSTSRTEDRGVPSKIPPTSKSVASDRLVDYKNLKNTRFENMSVNDKFNLDILNNSTNWGEYVASRDSKPKTTKYSNHMNKNVIQEQLLLTKRRVLNHKRKDFWNLKLQNRTSLPPPPMGKTYGHGILAKKIFGESGIPRDLNVTDLSSIR